MPDTASSSPGKGLKKKIGGQPVWAWAAEGVGAFLLYRWRATRNASNAALGTTSGQPTTTATSGTTGPGTSAPTTWAQWLAAALAAGNHTSGYRPGPFYNDLNNRV